MIEDDKPTRIGDDGTQYWELNGLLHRDDDLPAIVYPDGEKSWWQNGELHRKNNPAIINSTYQAWYKNGKLHRDDGPAIIRKNSDFTYSINGVLYTEKKFKKIQIKKMKNKLDNDLPTKKGNKEKKTKI